MKNLALHTLNSAINHYLQLDPLSKQRLQKLEGKNLRLIIKPLTLFFLFQNQQIKLVDQFEGHIDATIEGYPLAFIQLHLSSQENAPKLFKQKLTISGDLEFGQQVQTLFKDLDIDWEEHLSKLTGDVIAHEMSNIFKRSTNFASKLAQSMQDNLKDYLHHETRSLPCQEEINDFFEDIDNLRLRVDRLQANVARYLKETKNDE